MQGFCPAPWASLVITPTGRVTPCCSNQKVFSRFDARTFSKVREQNRFAYLRRSILQEKWPVGCSSCQERETLGLKSKRQKILENPLYAGLTKRGVSEGPQPLRYLEVSFSNRCNLACIMCTGEFSHLWKPIHRDLATNGNIYTRRHHGRKLKQSGEFQMDPESVAEVARLASGAQTVEILGGEPFLAPQLNWFLKRLSTYPKHPDRIAIATNGTLFKENTMQLLNGLASDITLNISLDGVEEFYEFIRGGRFKEVERNILSVLEQYPNFCVQFNPTFNIVSVFGIKKLLQWFANLSRRYPHCEIKIFFRQSVNYDDQTGFSALSLRSRRYIIQHLRSCLAEELVPQYSIADFAGFIQFMETCSSDDSPEYFESVREQLTYFVQKRKLDIFKHVPQLELRFGNERRVEENLSESSPI